MIYICDDISGLDSRWLQSAIELLPAQRRAHALRYRSAADRALCAAAYLLLRLALKREAGLNLSADFDHNPAGKPFLASAPELHFSISHCREAVAVALDSSPVGIDVEALQCYSPEVAALCCTPAEVQLIESAPDSGLSFTELWTRKESALKQAGELSPPSFRDLRLPPPERFLTIASSRYICTVCFAGPCPPTVPPLLRRAPSQLL